MVSARIDVNEDRQVSTHPRPRPALVLQDISEAPVPRRVAKRRSARRFENVLFTTAAAAVLLFFLVTFASSLWHSVQVRYSVNLAAAPVISKIVAPGDTLWKYAAHYGDPNVYILDRVDRIARVNHLDSETPLVPGQLVQIPVTNPIVLAQIQPHFSGTPVASR